jgi:hypothetical protein
MHTYMHTHTYVKMYPYKQTYFYMHFNFMWIYTLLLICLLSYNSDIKKKLRLGIPNLHRRYQVVTNGIYSWKWFLGIRPLKCNKKIYMFSLIKNHGFSNCPSWLFGRFLLVKCSFWLKSIIWMDIVIIDWSIWLMMTYLTTCEMGHLVKLNKKYILG